MTRPRMSTQEGWGIYTAAALQTALNAKASRPRVDGTEHSVMITGAGPYLPRPATAGGRLRQYGLGLVVAAWTVTSCSVARDRGGGPFGPGEVVGAQAAASPQRIADASSLTRQTKLAGEALGHEIEPACTPRRQWLRSIEGSPLAPPSPP